MVPSLKGSPKTKEDSPGKDPKGDVGNLAEVLKMIMENNQKTVEFVLNQTTRSSEKRDQLDQEDQRIKVMDLETLKDATEENVPIICGDWLHRN